ncbi:MAG: transposase [Paludibacter sp.]
MSLHDGYARNDHFDWNAYNEVTDLKMQVERYWELYGHYPKVVLVDKIYLTRDNRRWLKEYGITHTGDPLERKRVVNLLSAYLKRKNRSQCAELNHIEGKFGQGKRSYNLNNVRTRLSSTSTSWIEAIIFVMNILRHMKDISVSIFWQLFDKLIRIKQIIKNQIPKPTYNFDGFGIIR